MGLRSQEETPFHHLFLVVKGAPPRQIECAEFQKPLGEQRDLIKENGLCFGCYSSEPNAKICRSSRPFKTCQKKHLTSPHDYNWQPQELKTERRKGHHTKKNATRSHSGYPTDRRRPTFCEPISFDPSHTQTLTP